MPRQHSEAAQTHRAEELEQLGLGHILVQIADVQAGVGQRSWGGRGGRGSLGGGHDDGESAQEVLDTEGEAVFFSARSLCNFFGWFRAGLRDQFLWREAFCWAVSELPRQAWHKPWQTHTWESPRVWDTALALPSEEGEAGRGRQRM